jgi:hypothetical protein
MDGKKLPGDGWKWQNSRAGGKLNLPLHLGVLPMYKKNAQQWATKVGRRTLVKWNVHVQVD